MGLMLGSGYRGERREGSVPAPVAAATLQLQVSSNGRYLEDSGGTPFLLNGDTPWSMFTELTPAEVTTYLDDCETRGFNALLSEIIEESEYPPQIGNRGPENYNGDSPWATTAFVDFNEAYWSHADWVIQQAESRGIVMFLSVCYLGFGCGEQGWCPQVRGLTSQQATDYGTWLGARYKDQANIVWVGGGDTDPADYFDPNADLRHNDIMAALAAEDTNHLITSHSDVGNSALDDFNESWLSLNNTYADEITAPAELENDYNRIGTLPFFFIEGKYENEGVGGVGARSQHYWSPLLGASGAFYGNAPIWYFGSGYTSNFGDPGRGSLVYYRNLFASRPWHELVPDTAHTVLTAGVGSGASYAAASVSADTFIAYIPTGNQVTIDRSQLGGSTSQAWWYNPRTGGTTDLGTFSNTGTQNFTPPDGNDWVLVIDDDALGRGAPG